MWKVKELNTLCDIDDEINYFISSNHIGKFEVVGYLKGNVLTYALIKYWEDE